MHVITVGELLDFNMSQVIAASGTKRLWFVANTSKPMNEYIIYNNGKKIATSTDLSEAVEIYNNL